MKTKHSYSLIFAGILFCLTLTSCNPTIKISTPKDGATISKGEMVLINTEVESNQGEITEVRYHVDGVGISYDDDFPYRCQWFTNEASLGEHTIKAVAYDSEGGRSSTEIKITITASTHN